MDLQRLDWILSPSLTLCLCILQVTGKGPIANWKDHLADPMNTHMFAKAVVLPTGEAAHLACAIPETATFQGITFPTPCFLEGLWP